MLRFNWEWGTGKRPLTFPAGLGSINVQQGPIFSHSAMVLQAAIRG
ncbi:hypothetical protein ACZ87_02225 [Candidatus Erwinia dacicola]|uniref:Uncharacterized protein n=1 Tax=Candidatus Erwinia dacicola TaxID=252393 RepID=A0A328TT92_9GAMM|nr:hypothetical protein ACZ87_02225 [Candidatus Erwinia dacicola]